MRAGWWCGAVIGVSLSPGVWAQPAPLPAEMMLFTQEELTTTATRTAKPLSEAPSATAIITREEITRSGLWHLPDLLRRIPGVDVMSTTAAHSEVNVRGLNKALSPRTLVLVDGRTVFINAQGFTPWEAIPVLVEDIERIEVVKGPVQALYGSPALSGVINIITRSPFDVQGVETYQRYGSRRFLEDSVIYGGKINDALAYKLAGGWKEWDALEGDNHDALDRSTWSGALDWKIADIGHTALSAGITDGDFDLLPSDATGMGPMEHKTDFVELDTHLYGFQAKYFWNRYDFNVVTTNIDEDVTVDTHDVDLSHHITLGPHTLLGGGGVRYEQIDSNLFRTRAETKTETTWDIFAQDEWRISEPLTWFGTMRLDRHPITDYNIAYRTSLLFEPVENHVLWGTIGRTFRNPTMSESKISLRFPTLVAPAVSTVSVGEEGLDPELMQSFEIGYRSQWWSRLKCETSVFFNRMTDAISAKSGAVNFLDPAGPSATATFRNSGKANVIGGELGAEVFIVPGLSTFGSWTTQDVEREDGLPESDLSPKHKAVLGLSSEYKGFSGELFLQYVDAAAAPEERAGMSDDSGKVDPFWWTSARAGYAFNPQAEVALTIYNLFHNVHQEHAAGQELSSRFVVQATVKF